MMHNAEIRTQLQKVLGSEVRNELWDVLVELALVEDVAVGGGDINDLAEMARKIQGAGGARPAGRRAPELLKSDALEGSGRDSGTSRRIALSILVAQEALKEPEIRSFREEVLGGKILDHADVPRWIEQQAESDGPYSFRLSVPLEEDPDGAIEASHVHVALWPFGDLSPHASRFSPATRGKVIRGPGEVRFIEYSRPDDPWVQVRHTAVGGILERLWHLSRDLAHRYPWEPAHATMFVLTGLYPAVHGIDAEVVSRSPSAGTRIKLSVDPAVTPNELAEHYRGLRKQMSQRRHRSVSDKHLRLAAFVAERPAHESWEAKRRAWNRAYPDSRYPKHHYEHRSNFIRDSGKAIKRVLHPDYQDPVSEPMAPTFVSGPGREEDGNG